MLDPLENSPFNIPDYEHIEDERFPPLPPPHSPGQRGDEAELDPFANGEEEEGETSKLAEVPAAKKRGVKRPQPKLDSQRLISERGLPALRTLFDNVHFKGKGHEAEDVRLLMQRMENWAHRLYPKLQFDDFIDKVEKLGAKKDVQTCLKRIRLDMPLTHEDFIGKDDEETAPREEERVLGDPDPFEDGGFPDEPLTLMHSTPAPAAPSLTEEQRRRIELNKQLALERRLARTQQHTDTSGSQPISSTLSVDEPSSSSASSQLLSQLKDQDEEGEDVDLDQSGGAAEQLKDKAPHKDHLLSPDTPLCETGESSRSSAVPQLSNGCEDSD